MSQPVHLEVFYPYPPERVWQVLTDRRALTAWMMENDFEPKLGHKFQFYSQPLPGLKTTIQCEVVELEEPTRLVYTWQESPTAEPSLVIWTLTTVAGGTQLRLKHYQYSYTTAVASFNRPGTISAKRSSVGETARFYSNELFFSEMLSSAGLAVASPDSSLRGDTSHSAGMTIASEFCKFDSVEWDYFLNQALPNLLAQ